MRILLVILATLAVPSIAWACEESGTPIYKETRAPVDGTSGAREEIVVHRSGAWRTASWTDDTHEGPGDAGCLTRKRLAEVKAALEKARFALVEGGVCDAMSTSTITYASGKKRVATDAPCGQPIDRGTQRAAACVAAAIDASISIKQLRAICRKR